MKKLIHLSLLIAAVGCGSTGTNATGDDDDGAGTPFSCASFTAGAGIVCDGTTSPPTIRVDFGTGAGQAVEGDDPRLSSSASTKGKYIASFTPTAGTEAISGMLIKNPATGNIGTKAADELCKAKNPTFPGAHMCTNDEIHWNVRNGFITSVGQTGIASAPHWDNGTGGARNSFKGSCGDLTYNTGDLAYQGSRWTVIASDPKLQTANANLNALAVNFETGLACNTTGVPIACCE